MGFSLSAFLSQRKSKSDRLKPVLLKVLIRQKKQPVRREFDLPGLRKIAERFPFLLENFGLHVKTGGIRGLADLQIERDAKGRLRHCGKPAGKHVLADFCPGWGRRVNADVMRANRDVSGSL